MLDTNTCIFIIRKKPMHVFDRFKELKVGDIGISSIVLCELQFGVSKSNDPARNQTALTEFVAPLEIRDFPGGASPLYGRLREHLQTQGTPIGGYDMLIAAHALYEKTILITNNTKEFRRVPNLRMEDWV